MLAKVRYQERPERFEYRLTEKGLDLWPILISLLQFGDQHYAPNGPPVVLTHKDCGGTLDVHRMCERCGAKLNARTSAPTAARARPSPPPTRR